MPPLRASPTFARYSTAKMNGLNPQAYLADVRARINDHINPRLYELLPWNWKPLPGNSDTKGLRRNNRFGILRLDAFEAA